MKGRVTNISNYDLKTHIGSSDIASLVFRFGDGTLHEVCFGGDGDYWAYILKDGDKVPDYYTKECVGSGWLWIYDDDGRSWRSDAGTDYKLYTKIEVYRAREFGIIIKMGD